MALNLVRYIQSMWAAQSGRLQNLYGETQSARAEEEHTFMHETSARPNTTSQSKDHNNLPELRRLRIDLEQLQEICRTYQERNHVQDDITT